MDYGLCHFGTVCILSFFSVLLLIYTHVLVSCTHLAFVVYLLFVGGILWGGVCVMMVYILHMRRSLRLESSNKSLCWFACWTLICCLTIDPVL